MIPNSVFLRQPQHFWANVRLVSQKVGYTARGTGRVLVPTLAEISRALEDLGLESHHISDRTGQPTAFGETLASYFSFRAEVLNGFVEPRLMDVDEAGALFLRLQKENPFTTCPLPLNKQKGDKKSPAFFTGIINILIETNLSGRGCCYDARELTTVTLDGLPLRTLARRVDGAYPAAVNPLAIWEIKEYYYTTTFGSRVADGVYETMLDGMELEELYEHERIKIIHYLMIDSHYTWWECGRSYLCRIIDMLHMGYIDEVLFGREVVERLPEIVRGWVKVQAGVG
ncbi:MAG: DUF7687 domain-containing protein [Thermoleophilia bacterium]